MKEKLIELLKAKQEQRSQLMKALIDSDDKEERGEVNNTIAKLDEEVRKLETLIEDCDKPAQGQPEQRGQMFKLGSSEFRQEEDEDKYNTKEYRKAFKNFIATGKMPEEFREATKTTDSGISTVIPTNLANYILEKFEQLGTIFNLVTKTAYPVGQSIPTDNVKPTATWVSEGAGSTPQKKTLGSLITFTHHKLRCEVRMTQEVATMALKQFEDLFMKQVPQAMLRAIEAAIVDGDGSGKPTGILNYASTVPADRKFALADGASNKLTYKLLCDAEAAIPVEYEATAKWCMTKKTFMQFVGMVDANGQPIARTNHGISGKVERTLLGRDVILYVPQSGSALGTYADSVTADTIFAFICDFSDYVLNTNYDLGISHALDWDNEDHKTKAVMACDGKFIITDSLITLTKNKKATG